VSASDREVLEFIGPNGKSADEVERRFPGFETLRLIRAGFVAERVQDDADTVAHTLEPAGGARLYYALTQRGAAAIGVDQRMR
jgi:hypothetical protein